MILQPCVWPCATRRLLLHGGQGTGDRTGADSGNCRDTGEEGRGDGEVSAGGRDTVAEV